MPRRVLLASGNPKKLRELRQILDDAQVASIEVVGLADVPAFTASPETGATFKENALVKAREGAAASGLVCIADDSGLAVDALNGMPGVLSARWAGRHGDDAANNALLLDQLADVPQERRGARFLSVCALVEPGGIETVVRGVWPGAIARTPHGVEGFGYDPIFLPDTETGSAAQLSPERKNAISHRRRALQQLVPILATLAQDRA